MSLSTDIARDIYIYIAIRNDDVKQRAREILEMLKSVIDNEYRLAT
jgi:hypothetical protein